MAKADDSSPPQRDARESLREQIREAPLTSLAIAAAAGFLIGGGARSRIGTAMLAVVGRMAIQGVASSFIAAIANGDDQDRKTRKSRTDRE